MHKIVETVSTLWKAARYSLSFCFRSSLPWTWAKLGTAGSGTLIGYGIILSTGFVVNSVQEKLLLSQGERSMPWLSIATLIGMFVLAYISGRLSWYVNARWSHLLRHADAREMQNQRATLDVGVVRSKTYDDLDKRIRELPYGPRTRLAYTNELVTLISLIVSFVLFGATLLFHQPLYALVIFMASLPMIITEFRQSSWWWDLYQELVPHHKRRYVLEMAYLNRNAFVQGIMWNQMPSLRKQIDRHLAEEFEAYQKIRHRAVRNETLAHLVATAGFALVVVHVIWSTIEFASGMGTLTIIIAAANTFRANLENLSAQSAGQWNTAKGVVLIEEDFYGMKPAIQTIDPIVPNFQGAPCLRFDRVSFTYPDTEEEVLHEVSFAIEPCSKVAIVGRNGNGKSTIQKLLTRTYEPTSGAIYAEDINLRNIEPSVWNESVSTLLQDYIVLDRTVEEEIASSRLDGPLDFERVLEAARFSCFDEALGVDAESYKAQIGTEFGGREFSGGERQRLALARVKYRNTPILILDEPDASLDPETSERLMDKILNLEGVTVILITQHVSRTLECDKVIVMGKGSILEHGNPKDLYDSNGHYTKLFRSDRKRLHSTQNEEEQIGQ